MIRQKDPERFYHSIYKRYFSFLNAIVRKFQFVEKQLAFPNLIYLHNIVPEFLPHARRALPAVRKHFWEVKTTLYKSIFNFDLHFPLLVQRVNMQLAANDSPEPESRRFEAKVVAPGLAKITDFAAVFFPVPVVPVQEAPVSDEDLKAKDVVRKKKAVYSDREIHPGTGGKALTPLSGDGNTFSQVPGFHSAFRFDGSGRSIAPGASREDTGAEGLSRRESESTNTLSPGPVNEVVKELGGQEKKYTGSPGGQNEGHGPGVRELEHRTGGPRSQALPQNEAGPGNNPQGPEQVRSVSNESRRDDWEHIGSAQKETGLPADSNQHQVQGSPVSRMNVVELIPQVPGKTEGSNRRGRGPTVTLRVVERDRRAGLPVAKGAGETPRDEGRRLPLVPLAAPGAMPPPGTTSGEKTIRPSVATAPRIGEELRRELIYSTSRTAGETGRLSEGRREAESGATIPVDSGRHYALGHAASPPELPAESAVSPAVIKMIERVNLKQVTSSVVLSADMDKKVEKVILRNLPRISDRVYEVIAEKLDIETARRGLG